MFRPRGPKPTQQLFQSTPEESNELGSGSGSDEEQSAVTEQKKTDVVMDDPENPF